MIKDQFNRIFKYIRIAVNEKCNLRCIYCMPETGISFKPESDLLSKDEIVRVVRILTANGLNKVRLTGGEPLLRNDIVDIVKDIRQSSIESINMTTNGLLLHKYLEPLVEAGLSGFNLSLDTIRNDQFQQITRQNKLDQVMENLHFALSIPNITVKVNTVLMREVNEDDIPGFLKLAKEFPITIRFIELMPFDDFQIWKTGKFMGVEFILERIKKVIPDFIGEYGSKTEQYYFKPEGYKGALAIIPAYTRSLCEQCDRIRLTADGSIRNCLFSNTEYNLKYIMRNGCSDEDILLFIKNAMWHKPRDGFEAEKQNKQVRTSMTQIGG